MSTRQASPTGTRAPPASGELERRTAMAEEDPRPATASLPLRELAAFVSKDLAPEESVVLAALEEFDDIEAWRRLTAEGSRGDKRLGFGVEAVGALVCAIVWIGVDEAVRKIVDAGAGKVGRTRRRL